MVQTVMELGIPEVVEVLDATALRAGQATHPHTRELFELSRDLES